MASTVVDTPIGPVGLVSNGDALTRVVLPGAEDMPPEDGEDAIIQQATRELNQYFRGRRKNFTVPVCIEGTEFQEDAWHGLMQIPYGQTRSYADHAASIGRPGAMRAIGQANRSNPVPIIVPCHRVVKADGSLGGYAGELDEVKGLKASLLRLEGAIS